MKKRASVKMSIVSRFFVAVDNIDKYYNNQMILEGHGKIDIEEWKHAVKKASDANTGSRFVCRGFLGNSRWVDSGITPKIREVNGESWDGMGPDGAPFLKDPLPCYQGPTCEVLIINGSPLRMAFRTNHGVMDGRGTMTWAEDIFRALRNEPVVGSDPQIVEDEFLNMGPFAPKKITKKYVPPTGAPDKKISGGSIWIRKTIKGKFRKLLPKIMLLIAKEAWKHSDGPVKIGIPVDLRSRMEGIRTTNNLSNIFFIEVTKDATVNSLSDIISQRIKEKIDGSYTWEDKIVKYIPIKIIEKFIRMEAAKGIQTGLYSNTAYVSNLGRMPLKNYTGGGFTPDTGFFIPPGLGSLPFFMTLAGGIKERVEVLLTIPKPLASGGRIESVVENIAVGIHTMEEE